MEILSTQTLYFVGIGVADSEGHFAACQDCGFILPANLRRYRSLRAPANRTLEETLRLTNPDRLPELSTVEEVEARLREGKASPELKARLLFESIEAAEQIISKHAPGAGSILFAIPSFFVGLLTFLISVGLLIAADYTDQGRLCKIGAAAVFGAGVLLWLSLVTTARLRWVRGGLLPVLARSLVDLNPGTQELEEALAQARKKGMAIVFWTSAPGLRSRIQRELS